jgi:Zn-dependent peptidase ImmA (M78 family)
MAISVARINKIQELAVKILVDAGLYKIPIDVKKVCKSLGVNVLSYDLGTEVSGVLVLENDTATIGFNQQQSDPRKRFTIAHELGHFILHRKTQNDVFVDRDFIILYRRGQEKYSDAELLQEQEANAFAAAILMPHALIEEELKAKNYYSTYSELDLIEKLAKTFKVSSPAMTFRLNNLSVLS